MAHRPIGVASSFSYTAGSASTSSEFKVQSSVLRVCAVSNAAHVKIGVGTPSATNADYYIPSGQTATLALTKASNRVTNITTGANTVLTFAEGTQCPFAVGDFVKVETTGQPYFDASLAYSRVSSVNTTMTSGSETYQGSCTLDANTSGISTDFSAPFAVATIANKISARGLGAGTLYIQQVQTTGEA